ncbi:Uncharacterized protein BM_BM16921 [Brugia malayi]|nr:Uncharacterized protein BM_BM16921 [Brugia malayi]CRZ24016.1 Bm16921, isoform c [Brugia malayi]VIO86763.1 Uncharacterized protein BM_BM16921 [Brugia malayi]
MEAEKKLRSLRAFSEMEKELEERSGGKDPKASGSISEILMSNDVSEELNAKIKAA